MTSDRSIDSAFWGVGPDRTGAAVRLVVAVLGLACCVTALVAVAVLPSAVAARDARAVALNPQPAVPDDGWRPQAAVGTAQFVATQSQWSLDGRLVRQTDLFAPDPANVPPPPGVPVFPRPGEVVLSPVLARLLAATGDPGLGGRIDGAVVGGIDPAGLLGPDDLRFYRGTATPSPPAADRPSMSVLAVGWGFQPTSYGLRTGDQFGGPLKALLVAGSAVIVLVAGGLLVLLPRLGATGRDRRAHRLRSLGAPDGQLRRTAIAHGAATAAAGVLLGIGGFLLFRAADGTFFPTDLAVTPQIVALILITVAGVTIAGSRWAPAPPEPLERPVAGSTRSRPYGAQVVVLLTAAATVPLAVSVGRHTRDTGLLAMGTITLATLSILGTVGVLVPWLVDLTVARRTVLGDPRVVRALSRPFGAAAGVSTAVLVLSSVAGARGRGGSGPLGARADLVAAARAGTWVGVVLIVLLLLVGGLLAGERTGCRTRLIVLLAAGWGSALAGPVAVTLSWMIGRAVDLDVPASPVPVLVGVAGAVVVVAVIIRAGAATAADPRPVRSA